jgi:hypothetical protein
MHGYLRNNMKHTTNRPTRLSTAMILFSIIAGACLGPGARANEATLHLEAVSAEDLHHTYRLHE